MLTAKRFCEGFLIFLNPAASDYLKKHNVDDYVGFTDDGRLYVNVAEIRYSVFNPNSSEEINYWDMIDYVDDYITYLDDGYYDEPLFDYKDVKHYGANDSDALEFNDITLDSLYDAQLVYG